MPMRPVTRAATTALLLLAWPVAAAAQDAPTLSPEDYDRWERLGAFELDPTGRWLVAAVVLGDGTEQLRVRAADGSGEPIVLEHATGPAFSADGRFLAYRKGTDADEDADTFPDRLGLVDLERRADTVLFEVDAFAFRDDGAWLAALGPAPSDSVGGDLVVLRPGTARRTVVGNVDDFAWQEEGPALALTLRTASAGTDGVVVLDPEADRIRTLVSGSARFRAPTWREGAATLVALRSVEDPARDGEGHELLLWGDVWAGEPPRVLDVRAREDVPDTLTVGEGGEVSFARDGRTVFLGLAPWPRADTADADPGDGTAGGSAGAGADAGNGTAEDRSAPSDVQVWHWNDDRILRAQEYNAARDARRTLAAAWHLEDDRLVVLADELDEEAELVAGGRWAVVPDYDPYHVERRFGSGAADWYRVDVRTGERTLLAERAEFGVETHPDAEHVLVYHDEHWTAVPLATLRPVPLGAGRSFTQSLVDYDYPGPRPPWGVGGWVREGAEPAPPTHALLYDRGGVWSASLADGALERLTPEEGGAMAGAAGNGTPGASGAANGTGAPAAVLPPSVGVRYRVVDPDPDRAFGEPVTVEAGAPLWLSVFDRGTKESGYALRHADGRLDRAVYQDARVSGLVRAERADRLALRIERWDDSPDVFVGGASLGDLRQITRTNPLQEERAWGRTELLRYTTDAGLELQAILTYPADFEEGRRYPLILYQYERLSDDLHRYHVPSERTYYDLQTWSQRGYFVLQPDIVYEPGRPGPSALDAVEHALDAAIATGHVDPAGLGLVGHSWGGYQATYLPTRTDRFAAAVAGAPITNFLSFMGAVHWNGGLPETGHWETGQARMAAPYWEDLEGHLESSPAHGIADLETPVLVMHGDEDGVVDFGQGLEFYNYARRAGKEVVLLVYPGADHGLADEAQQRDYHRRILEWFDHHLKGAPPARWIVEGESWAERAKRLGGRD